MSLDARIMNIQADPDKLKEMDQPTLLAYKEGHRDARHAAAEIAGEEVARIHKIIEDYQKEAAEDQLLDFPEPQYIIIHAERNDLFWSNELGWVDRDSADFFSMEERNSLNLPINGIWRIT